MAHQPPPYMFAIPYFFVEKFNRYFHIYDYLYNLVHVSNICYGNEAIVTLNDILI